MHPELDKCCRTCMSENATVDIFVDNQHLLEKLTACVKFQVDDSSKYPRKMCECCINSLCNAFIFLKQCEDTNKQFLEIISKQDDKVKVKEELKVEYDECSFQEDAENSLDYIEVKNEELLDCLTKSLPDITIKKNNKLANLKSKRNYECTECNKLFQSKSAYYRHIRKHKIITNKKELLRSIKQNNKLKGTIKKKESRRTCVSCRKVFVDDVDGYNEHILSKVCRDTTVYRCDKCGKEYSGIRRHEIHMQMHNNENTPCEFCGKVFARRNLLRKHVKSVHNREPDCICKLCKRTFKNQIKLANHMKIIHPPKEKYVKCDLCGFSSKFKSSLRAHMRSHLNIRPYKCQYCSKSFTIMKSKTDHERLHTGETPYKCPVCSLGFTQKGNMKSHFRHNHKDIAYFELPKPTD